MKSFLAGLGIGIGLGVLFAPMSGEETRNNLTQRAGDLADSARRSRQRAGAHHRLCDPWPGGTLYRRPAGTNRD